METHHPHHPTHKKKWTEYLLEFFMLFFAVFLGFIAENIREKITDSEKEKGYVKSFIQDLKADTISLRFNMQYMDSTIAGVDSILKITRTDLKQLYNRKEFYKYVFKYLSGFYPFTNRDITLSQLRNSGGYRYIQKDHVADSIASYEALIKQTAIQGDYYRNGFDQLWNLREEIMNITFLPSDTGFLKRFFSYDSSTILTDNEKQIFEKLFPVDSDQKQLRLFTNKVTFFLSVMTSYKSQHLKRVSNTAARLIVYLKKEYNMENE